MDTIDAQAILRTAEILKQERSSPTRFEWLVVLTCGLAISALTWAGVIWVVSRLFLWGSQ